MRFVYPDCLLVYALFTRLDDPPASRARENLPKAPHTEPAARPQSERKIIFDKNQNPQKIISALLLRGQRRAGAKRGAPPQVRRRAGILALLPFQDLSLWHTVAFQFVFLVEVVVARRRLGSVLRADVHELQYHAGGLR